MKIVRDDKGRISEIIRDESDGDFNVVDIFKAVIEADKEIAIVKSRDRKEVFSKVIQSVSTIIDSYDCDVNEGYDNPDFRNKELRNLQLHQKNVLLKHRLDLFNKSNFHIDERDWMGDLGDEENKESLEQCIDPKSQNN